MYGKLPMYQNVGPSAYKKDLNNIIKLTNHLNNPHKDFKSIHIAGTNGKGSTAHMLSSILQESKYNVGLYTCPLYTSPSPRDVEESRMPSSA